MAHVAGSSALADAGCIIPEIYKQNQNDMMFRAIAVSTCCAARLPRLTGGLPVRLPLGVNRSIGACRWFGLGRPYAVRPAGP